LEKCGFRVYGGVGGLSAAGSENGQGLTRWLIFVYWEGNGSVAFEIIVLVVNTSDAAGDEKDNRFHLSEVSKFQG
jgi:hypothetical protein